MKKVIVFIVVFSVFCNLCFATGVENSASSAIVINAKTRTVIYEKNSKTKRAMASTTKIMTALLVLEQAGLDEIVEIPQDAVGVEGTSLYIKKGENAEKTVPREIKEELDAEIHVGKLMETVEWDYPEFHLTMHCFICTLQSVSLNLNEHEAAAWLTREILRSVCWLPADEGLISRLENEI